jgi:PAS domain S-box-containing protein
LRGAGLLSRLASLLQKPAARLSLRLRQRRYSRRMSETIVPSAADILDLMMDAVFVVDRHGRLEYASRGCVDLLGYRPEELVGTYMIEMVHPDDRGRTLNAVWKIMAGDPSIRFENRWKHKEGHHVAIQWSARWSEEHQVRVAVARAV